MAHIFFHDECVVCLDAGSTQIFNPCLHCCVCEECYTLIKTANMDCPVCRAPIERVDVLADDASRVVSDPGEAKAFIASEERKSYKKVLHSRCAANAGFSGRSKQARAVAATIGTVFDQARQEREGTNRYRGAAKAQLALQEDGRLKAVFKVGRREETELVPVITDADGLPALIKEAEVSDDVQLATDNPTLFWNACFLVGFVALDKLCGGGRKRRRRK